MPAGPLNRTAGTVSMPASSSYRRTRSMCQESFGTTVFTMLEPVPWFAMGAILGQTGRQRLDAARRALGVVRRRALA